MEGGCLGPFGCRSQPLKAQGLLTAPFTESAAAAPPIPGILISPCADREGDVLVLGVADLERVSIWGCGRVPCQRKHWLVEDRGQMYDLPPGGWLARQGDDFLEYSAIQEGKRVDFVDSPVDQ